MIWMKKTKRSTGDAAGGTVNYLGINIHIQKDMENLWFPHKWIQIGGFPHRTVSVEEGTKDKRR